MGPYFYISILDGYSERANDAGQLALDAVTVSREASDTITDIEQQLPEDQARVDQMRSDIHQVNADILKATEKGKLFSRENRFNKSTRVPFCKKKHDYKAVINHCHGQIASLP